MSRDSDRAEVEPRLPQLAKLALIVLATVALAGVVIAHVDVINGSRFHRWGWWSPRISAYRIYPAMLLAGLPFAAGQFIYHRSRRILGAIVLVSCSTFLLQLVALGMQRQPFDLGRTAEIVEHPWTTSYFTDAQSMQDIPLRQWLARYHLLLPSFHLHSREKPPGPILYWWICLKLFDQPGSAALAGSFVLALIASLAVPATFWLTRIFTNDDRSALFAASWMALVPAIVLFFPTFDQCYPLLTCGIIGCWLRALQTRKLRWAVACGIVLSPAIFFSYTILVLGAFMVLAGIVVATRDERGVRTVLVQFALVLVTVVAIYLTLKLVTGFDSIATFRTCWRDQKEWEASFAIPRPHPQTVPGDLQDFLLGSGWISALLILFWLIDARRRWNDRSILVVLALVQPLIVAATGLLQAETARVWGFMQPLVMVPVGLELTRWSPLMRAAAYACLLLLLAAQAQNLIFLF